MSRQFRYRMAALGLSGLIFGAPLLMNGTASADQVEANERQVSFGGSGVMNLSCDSRPSVESMTVPARSVVWVLNQTGHDAQLRLAGAPKGTIPAYGAAEVVFRRGTTAVLLTPDCSFGEAAMPVMVTAAPSASSAQPGPTPAPASGDTSAVMSKPATGPGSPSRTSTRPKLPDTIAPATRPVRVSSGDSRPRVRRPAEPRAAATPTIAARVKTKSLRGTAGIGAPAFAGMPPGDRKTFVSPAAPRSRAALPTPAQTGTEDSVPAVEATGPSGLQAAEPVAAVGRIEDGHPLGLLGLTALVCILGVTTAAIRAIVSQRASRANIA